MLSQLTRFVRSRATSDAAYGRVWVVASSVVFGAMAVATRSVASELGAAQIAVVRFALDLVAVAAVVVWRPPLLRMTRPFGLAARGLLGGGAVLGYFMAIEQLSAGLGTMLNYTFPLWAALFAAIFLGEVVTWWKALGMIVATSGLLVVVGPTQVASAIHGLGASAATSGLIAGALSAVLGGGATTTVRWLRRTESAIAIFGAFCLGGLLVCLGPALRDWRPISGRAAWLLVVVAALSFAGQMLYTYALKFVTAGAGSLAMQLTVVVSYLLAALLLGEPISAATGAGGLLVMLGVTLVSLEARVRDVEPTPEVE